MPKRTTNAKWVDFKVGESFSIPELRHFYELEKSLLVDTSIRNFLSRQIKLGNVERKLQPGNFSGEIYQIRYLKIKDESPRGTKKIPTPKKFDQTFNASELGVIVIDSFIKMKSELKQSAEELSHLKDRMSELEHENAELKLCVQKAEKEKIECQNALNSFVEKYNSKSIKLQDVMTIHS